MRSILLVVHIAAGATGLAVAWPALFAPKRRGWHPRFGRIFAIAAVVLSLTAFALVGYDPGRLIGLAVLGVLTLGWVVAGVWIARRKPRMHGSRAAWRIWHLNLMCSSVISFVTAFLVQLTDGNLVAWILPTIVGSVLIARRTARETRSIAPQLRVTSHPPAVADTTG